MSLPLVSLGNSTKGNSEGNACCGGGTCQPSSTAGIAGMEGAIRERYSAASQQVEPALCCPVSYDPQFLKVLPEELIERDYGCGDPSKHVKTGDVVLDLGSGGGKICYIASQMVGPTGKVIGVDMNLDMLGLARKYQKEIAAKIGWDNVEFHQGRIQDLRLDLDWLQGQLEQSPVQSSAQFMALVDKVTQQCQEKPLIGDGTVSLVLSNCVLNLVSEEARASLFAEIYRVLQPGGRAVISDIVASQSVPQSLKDDPVLWSGCISGAFEEQEFITRFRAAGFSEVTVLTRQTEPWTTVAGIEFRSLTVQAIKGA